MMATLHHASELKFQIIAQIIKAKFIIGAIGNITGISGASFIIIKPAFDTANAKAKEFINLTHPASITACQIIIHSDHMNAFACQRVQENRQGGNKCFTFPCLHLCDLSIMQNNAAHKLNIKMTLTKGAFCPLTHKRKSIN